jgi:exosortase
MTPATPRPAPWASPRTALLLVPLGCFAWSFWPTFVELVRTWRSSDQYSHGFLVPFFAAFLLWLRRDRLDVDELRPSLLLGVPLLMFGLGLRLAGAYYFYAWFDPLSIVPCVAGAVLLLGGWAAWRWSWPGVLFLSFMLPLPYRLGTALSLPLQRLATVVSTFVLQMLGLPALAEGNTILLNEESIGIVEACSGLRMLIVFFALATAVALLTKKSLLERGLLVLSAVPIALISNVLRIVATGILYETTSGETARAFFHDVAGWLMMPLGLGLLWLELVIFARLFIQTPTRYAVRSVRPANPAIRRAKPAAKAVEAGQPTEPAAAPTGAARARQAPPPRPRASRTRVTGAPRNPAPTPPAQEPTPTPDQTPAEKA